MDAAVRLADGARGSSSPILQQAALIRRDRAAFLSRKAASKLIVPGWIATLGYSSCMAISDRFRRGAGRVSHFRDMLNGLYHPS